MLVLRAHHWQFFDAKNDRWVSRSRIEFPITGGADGGYRGYSLKNNIEPGKWRVRVETVRGQVLGEERFRIEISDTAPPLEEQVL